MAKGYIFDKLLNRKIEGETDLANAESVASALEEKADKDNTPKIANVGNVTSTPLPEGLYSGDIVTGLLSGISSLYEGADSIFTGVLSYNVNDGSATITGVITSGETGETHPVCVYFDDSLTYSRCRFLDNSTLYKHDIMCKDDENINYNIIAINEYSETFTNTQENREKIAQSIRVYGWNDDDSSTSIFSGYVDGNGNVQLSAVLLSNGEYISILLSSISNDTVTPL